MNIPRLCAFALVLLPLSLLGGRLALAKDCGERPTGKNPSIKELTAAIEELSMTFEIPTEIIKGVAHRESGVQQWRADGSLVINEKDCGFGMMQLTGATAEQYDVPRLKSDWRYNLEAGVRTLQTKWKRGIRTHWKGRKLPPPDPAILENWYYALSLYQGRRTGEYPGKIFDHMNKRPGKLKQLLSASVEASFPDDAFPGFSYGTRYTALPENKVVFEDGKTIKVKTTRGTIGDPALLAKLDEVLKRAEKALKKKDVRRAVRYFELVLKQGADSEQGRQAKEALTALSKEASALLEQGEKAAAAEDWAGALIAYDEAEDRFLGLPEAEEAARRAEAIREDPTLREQAARLEAEKEARFLLAKAERALAKKKVHEGVRLLRLIPARYGDTATASEAENRLRVIEEDPDLLAALEAHARERAVRETLAMGEAYLQNQLAEKAIAKFREVLALVDEGPAAERARAGLMEAEELDE